MWKLLSTTAIILTLSGPVWAQTSGDPGSQADKDLRERVETTPLSNAEVDRTNYPFLGAVEGSWTSENLIGMPIQTPDGQVIGEVESVIFTPDDRIMGVVVDAGDYLGTDSRPVVVDWYAVNVRPSDRLLVVDLDSERFETAPDYAMSDAWRAEKEAGIPDVAETQPGVITGMDTGDDVVAPGTGGGGPERGGDTAGDNQ